MDGMGTNGTSNVSVNRRLIDIPVGMKARTIAPSTPATTFDTPWGAPAQDDTEPSDERSEEEDDFMTTTEEGPGSSPMPWIIGIGAVAALGVGSVFLWKFLSKDEEPQMGSSPSPVPNVGKTWVGTVNYQFEDSFEPDDVIRGIGEQLGGESVGSGMMMATMMRDIEVGFVSRSEAQAFVVAAKAELKRLGVKDVSTSVRSY